MKKIFLLILGPVLLLIVLYFIFTQRKLVSLRERVSNSLSQISVQIKSRWDALMEIANAVSSYSAYESKTLKDIIEKRSLKISGPLEADREEKALNSALKSVFALAESYPDLKSEGLFQNAIGSINDYENKVRMSRMVYNDTVTRYNELVKFFPSSLIAGILNYKPLEYFDQNVTLEMPHLDFGRAKDEK